MFTIEPLFFTPIIRVHIDPKLYDKDSIVNTINTNYVAEPFRNNWDKLSNLHHYYDDWESSKHKEPNLDTLLPVYNDVFSKFVNHIPSTHPINYEFSIANITVYKNKDTWMNFHHHMNNEVSFACVHYLSVNKDSAPLKFTNPLGVHTHFSQAIIKLTKDKLNLEDSFNSYLCQSFNCDVNEDEMIIFPCFLLHGVFQKKTTKKLRIGIATNLSLF